jgi:hypothetical protein
MDLFNAKAQRQAEGAKAFAPCAELCAFAFNFFA